MPLNYYDWYLCDSDKNYNSIIKHNIPVIAQAPFKGGHLIKELPREVENMLTDSYGRPLSQIALDFVQDKNPEIILSGCSTLQTLIEYERSYKNYQPIENYEPLEKAIDIYKQQKMIPCLMCGRCAKVCPQGIEIPLHILMYNRTLQNKDKHFSDLSLLRYYGQEPIHMCMCC